MKSSGTRTITTVRTVIRNAKIRSLKRKRKNPRTQLNILWHRKKDEFKTKDLIDIIKATDCLLLMEKAVSEFLKKDDPNFSDFYTVLEKAKMTLEKHEGLKKRFWKKYLALCTIDNLAELSEDGEKEAMTELFIKTGNGSIKNNKSKQVLTRQFEKFTEKETRTKIWGKIKKLDPNEEELKYLLDLESMYSYPEITSEIEKLLREIHKTKEKKAVRDLLNLANQIKTKKGQS